MGRGGGGGRLALAWFAGRGGGAVRGWDDAAAACGDGEEQGDEGAGCHGLLTEERAWKFENNVRLSDKPNIPSRKPKG